MGVRLVNGELVNDDGSTADPIAESVDEIPSGIRESSSDAPECEVCGGEIPWAGRGRRPKYHPEHRPTAPKRSGSQPARSGTIRNEAALREALLARYMQMGGLLSMLHPAYGMGVKQKAEEAVNADIEYARVSPAFRRSLEAMLEKTALGAVIAVHVAMFAPVVVGEQAKRMRKKGEKAQTRNVPVQSPPATARGPQAPPQTPPPSNVHYGDFPSTESDAAPESINAGALPGMPG